MSLFIKGGILIALFAILVSLSSGLFFLLKDSSESKRTVKALTVRITLSVALFLFILLGIATGIIKPHPAF